MTKHDGKHEGLTAPRVLCGTLGAILLCAAGAAQAQVPNVDPAGSAPLNAPASGGLGIQPPPPRAPDMGAQPNPDPERAGKAPQQTGVFLNSDEDQPATEDQSLHNAGTPPDTHVVKKGDTLWDICSYYFGDPWRWPKIWSYNPTITNPHWIYPGDVVRLAPAGEVHASAAGPTQAPQSFKIQEAPAPASRGIETRQIAFVGLDDMKVDATIAGSTEEKQMLSPGDEVFLDYPSGKPPQIHRRYAIYTKEKDITHPATGKKIGAYVQLRGEVEILEVKKDKKARGVITYVTDVVERGQLVGDMKTQFKELSPVAAEKDLEGVVAAVLGSDQLIGASQIVFLDRGADDGLRPGNRMLVVRRGDAYKDKMGPTEHVERNNKDFPDDVIAEIAIVETGKKTSVGVVTRSFQEAEPGDHAVTRKEK